MATQKSNIVTSGPLLQYWCCTVKIGVSDVTIFSEEMGGTAANVCPKHLRRAKYTADVWTKRLHRGKGLLALRLLTSFARHQVTWWRLLKGLDEP